jgi:rare lipoprotein A
MRYLLPLALAAAAIVPVASGAADVKQPKRRPARRANGSVSLHVSRHNALAGAELTVHGRVRPGGPHRVKLVVSGPDGGVLARTADRRGAFRMRWALRGTGIYRLRAFGVHDRRVTGSESVIRRVTAYRPATASYYGPGLYGGALACGGTLEPGTLGVAHKTLPCGTRVKLRYRGRSITVPVVDRGPYVAGRDFDLTAATRERLRFPSTGVVLSSR